MEHSFLESFVSLSWLINYTRDVSILICFIFVIKFIAAKRLPAWWSYNLWLILLVQMFILWKFQGPLSNFNVVSVSIGEELYGSISFQDQAVLSSMTKEMYFNVLGWNVSFDKMLFFFWLLGALILGMYITVKNIRFGRMVEDAPALTDKKALDLLENCKKRLEVRRSIKVIITDKVKSPALLGIFRPLLLMPEGVVEKFNRDELAYIYMHEIGHLKRHDILVSYLITFFQIIHWFNPLVWFAFYHVRLDQESSCDALVLSRLNHRQPVEYANVIVGFLERSCHNRRLPSMACIMESKSQMKKRLAMIVNYKKYPPKRISIAIILLVAIGLIFFTFSALANEIYNKHPWDRITTSVVVDAMQAMKEKQFNEAEKIITAHLSDNPDFVPDVIYLMLGNVYGQQKKLISELSILTRGKNEYPDNEEINNNLMNCYGQMALENKDYSKAAKIFEEIYDLYPDNKSALAIAATSYFQAGEIDQTKRIYERMLDVSYDRDIMWLERIIRVCLMLGMEDGAEVYREKLRDTGLFSVYSDLSSLKHDNGNVYAYEPPKIVKIIDPQYPVQAEAGNISGSVELSFTVTKDGKVKGVSVVESNPEGVFDKSAIVAVEQYLFKPATKDGEAVDVVVNVPISFKVY